MHQVAKALGWSIKPGVFQVCQACAEAKSKQKNIPANTEHIKASKTEPRVHLDISTIKDPEGVELTKSNWRIMVDERTGMKFSDFFARKSDMIEPTCQKLFKWKQAGLGVKFIRLDNAGENKALQERAESAAWKLDINWEYTARDTPQQNSLAEVAFTIIAAQGCAMMIAAHIPADIHKKVWREAFLTATDLDALAVIEIDGVSKTRVEHWSGQLPGFAKHL